MKNLVLFLALFSITALNSQTTAKTDEERVKVIMDNLKSYCNIVNENYQFDLLTYETKDDIRTRTLNLQDTTGKTFKIFNNFSFPNTRIEIKQVNKNEKGEITSRRYISSFYTEAGNFKEIVTSTSSHELLFKEGNNKNYSKIAFKDFLSNQFEIITISLRIPVKGTVTYETNSNSTTDKNFLTSIQTDRLYYIVNKQDAEDFKKGIISLINYYKKSREVTIEK